MAKKATKKKRVVKRSNKTAAQNRPIRNFFGWVFLILSATMTVGFLFIVAYAFINPPITHTMWSEWRRLGEIERRWVDADNIAPVMLRAVVAAEDANYCLHWGFDMEAIRVAIQEGANRGASTISQQTVKNVFLWQERSWARKALEAGVTPIVEGIWSKRRILEVYLNVAEFGEGIFGIEAAARHYYGISASKLTARQASRLAVLLPSPKKRDPRNLSAPLRRRASRIAMGAAAIRVDGRSDCFED